VGTIFALTISQPRDWAHWQDLAELAQARRSDQQPVPPPYPSFGVAGGLRGYDRMVQVADRWLGRGERSAETISIEWSTLVHIVFVMLRRLERLGLAARRDGQGRRRKIVLWSRTKEVTP